MNQYNRLNDEARDAYSEPNYQIFAFESSDLILTSGGAREPDDDDWGNDDWGIEDGAED